MATYHSEQSLMLSMLNDDCIFKILDWMPLDTIFSYSSTCVRLRRLCTNYFQRKYQNEIGKTVGVRLSSEGRLLYDKKYVTYFNNVIKNLYICGGYCTYETMSKQHLLASFVKTKCHPNLHGITICNNMQFNPFCKEVSKFLYNVKSVTFVHGTDPHLLTFLDYCPNLTTLSLTLLRNDEMIDEALGRKYPKLKHLHVEYFLTSQLKPEQWKTFLQENKQIQCLEFSGRSIHQLDVETAIAKMECIRTIANLALNLEHLFLVVDETPTKHFEQVVEYSKKLCDRSNFKSLELKFNSHTVARNLLVAHANPLAKFKQLRIRIAEAMSISDFKEMFSPFTHLKSIVLERLRFEDLLTTGWSDVKELKSLVDRTQFDALPALEELTIAGDVGKEIFYCLMLFARHRKNLKKLSVFKKSSIRRRTAFPVADLNQAREKLKDAQQLTIFTDCNGNTTDLCHRLVKLQCVEREFHYSVEASQKYCMSSTGYTNFTVQTAN